MAVVGPVTEYLTKHKKVTFSKGRGEGGFPQALFEFSGGALTCNSSPWSWGRTAFLPIVFMENHNGSKNIAKHFWHIWQNHSGSSLFQTQLSSILFTWFLYLPRNKKRFGEYKNHIVSGMSNTISQNEGTYRLFPTTTLSPQYARNILHAYLMMNNFFHSLLLKSLLFTGCRNLQIPRAAIATISHCIEIWEFVLCSHIDYCSWVAYPYGWIRQSLQWHVKGPPMFKEEKSK